MCVCKYTLLFIFLSYFYVVTSFNLPEVAVFLSVLHFTMCWLIELLFRVLGTGSKIVLLVFYNFVFQYLKKTTQCWTYLRYSIFCWTALLWWVAQNLSLLQIIHCLHQCRPLPSHAPTPPSKARRWCWLSFRSSSVRLLRRHSGTSQHITSCLLIYV